jgi:hypothetical protein
MATKNKFGVPLTTTAGSQAGILMPKLKYRFRVTLNGLLNDERSVELTQNVQSVTRPAVTYDEVVVDSYNSKVYMHGKHTWDPVTLVIRDDITNRVSKLVGNQVQRQVNHYQQTTPAAGNDYKFGMIIELLDGTSATATETWELEGCFIQNVNYSDSDYSASTDPIQITLAIRFDNALHLDSLFDEGIAPPSRGVQA